MFASGPNSHNIPSIARAPRPDLSLDPASFQTMKLPIPLSYRIASAAGTVVSPEGSVEYKKGDALMTGTRGENWAITGPKFRASYDYADGTARKKPILVWAKEMHVPFEVKVNWQRDTLKGAPGDYLLQYSYADQDFGVVEASIFEETYYTSDRPLPNGN